MEEIKLVIVDDHIVIGRGTRQILESEPGFRVLAEASSSLEALQFVEQFKPDIVILDIAMPGMNGIDVTRKIKLSHPEMGIFVISNYDNDQFVFSLLEAGAAGYLLKEASGQDIISAVKAIKQGGTVLHPMVANKVIKRLFPDPRPAKQTENMLGEREMEVLRLAGKAFSNQEIARELGLSLHTVEAHMRHIFAKLGVGSRTEAVLFALRQDWVTIADPK